MRNYLKAELFRNFHHRILWGCIACIVGCGLLGCIAFEYMNICNGANLTIELVMTIGVGVIPAYTYLMGAFSEMTMGEEFKNNTIKNIASSGLSRGKIYVCKVIESIILMAFVTFVSFVLIVLLGYLILGSSSSEEFISILKECVTRGSIALILWSGAIAVSVFLIAVFKNSTTAILIYVALIMSRGEIFRLLGRYMNPIFTHMKKYLLTTQLNQLVEVSQLSSEFIGRALVVGFGSIVVMTFLGYKVLKRADV